MKKTLIFSTMCLLSLAACQKEKVSVPQSEQIARSIEVIAPETKSLYEEGVGVRLTGTEPMTVNMWTDTDNETATGMKALNPATGNGDGTWAFSHDAVAGATAYGYQFILPYTSKNAMNSKGESALLRLYPVQYPGKNTFDANQDYLLGQSLYGEQVKDAAVKFKRLFTPLQVQISDPDGVLADQTVYAVRFHINATPAVKNSLVGNAYVNAEADFDKAGLTSFNNNTNTVTAMYGSGLGKTGEYYNAWYMVYPVQLGEATEVEVSVFTDKGRYTKTATLSELKLQSDKLNRLAISLSGEGYSAGADRFIVTSVYTNKTRITERFSGITWVGSSNLQKDTAPSTLEACLRLQKAGGLTYTNNEINIKKVRLYVSHQAANNDVRTIHFADAEDNALCEDVSVKYNDIVITDGYAEVEFSKAVNSFTLTNSSASGYAFISGIQVIPE